MKAGPAPVPTGWKGILDPGERILWQGRPDGAVTFSGGGLAQTGFGLVFLGFSLFWTFGAASMTIGEGVFSLFPLFGLPFIAIGCYLVFGHFFWDAYLRRVSHYTLTDRRAFIAREVLGRRSLQSWPIKADTVLELTDEGPLTNIRFAEEWRRTRNGSTRHPIGFERIAEGREVYALLRQIQRDMA